MSKYITGKGVLIGTFTEEDITKGLDKVAVEKAKKTTGLSYVNTHINQKKGIMKIYLCTLEDCDMSPTM